MHIVGLFSSSYSIFKGVNSWVVSRNFPTYNKRIILKCFIYTLPDILIRILLFPVAWLLLSGYAFSVNALLSLLYFFVYKCLDPEQTWNKIILYSLSIQALIKYLIISFGKQLSMSQCPSVPMSVHMIISMFPHLVSQAERESA